MLKGNLTRSQAVAIIGEAAVHEVDYSNCEPTGRVGYNGACQGDDLCEWSASAGGIDKDGTECSVVVYFYTTNEDDDLMAAMDGDGSYIDWQVNGYEVV